MTDRTCTVTMTAEERFVAICGLGVLWAQMGSAAPHVGQAIESLLEKLMTTPSQDSQKTSAAFAELVLPPPTTAIGKAYSGPLDYFAADRKGNVPITPPTGAELETVSIVSAQEKASAKGKYLQVIFGGARGKANCFDPQLWPHLKKAQGHDAQVWIAESGNYLNIVGVRA